MGYTTEFEGHVDITPPLTAEEVAAINKFGDERHHGTEFPEGSFYCQWIASEDGTLIEWDGNEKFYAAPEWMEYLIEHFLKDNHSVNGVIRAYGEEPDDLWTLTVCDNKVSTKEAEVQW